MDGAIHRAAGPELLQECKTLAGCPTGDAKITSGYALKSRYVIHTVGPVYSEASTIAPHLLASAYRRSLDLAAEKDLKSIAFPAISTGVYGYPLAAATDIALGTCAAFSVSRTTSLRTIRFVLFNVGAYRMYTEKLSAFKI